MKFLNRLYSGVFDDCLNDWDPYGADDAFMDRFDKAQTDAERLRLIYTQVVSFRRLLRNIEDSRRRPAQVGRLRAFASSLLFHAIDAVGTIENRMGLRVHDDVPCKSCDGSGDGDYGGIFSSAPCADCGGRGVKQTVTSPLRGFKNKLIGIHDTIIGR